MDRTVGHWVKLGALGHLLKFNSFVDFKPDLSQLKGSLTRDFRL
jgi:hypothetical protein